MLKTDFEKFASTSKGSNTALKQTIFKTSIYPKNVQCPVKKITSSTTSKYDIYESIKPLIGFGRVASIIPCGESNFRSYKKPKFHINILPVLISIFFVCWTITEMIVGFDVMLKSVEFTGQKQGSSIMTYAMYSYAPMEAMIKAYLYV
ncbi:unnamed protein product [Orchesella dallaii]|uniref:Uncharacterized protein n=1 Tax=Orchesella dallaii TaxID=48710 RepID=A0ABP1RWJ0_9HEXA